ncbi:hypothetical protein FRB93_013011 [Tulasnella sp. JGI-2019a]|nr:hypothetical protein FRB93_013011 [Tulasnella sp. JGI-2019a]
MTASTPPPSKTNRRVGDAKRRIVGHVNYSAAPQLHQELGVKQAKRSKSGCMTCRIRNAILNVKETHARPAVSEQ